MTGEEAAAGGGAGGERGTHFLLLAGSLPGTVPAPSQPPRPGRAPPPPPQAPARAPRRRPTRPSGPPCCAPTSPGAGPGSEMPLQQQVSGRDGPGAAAARGARVLPGPQPGGEAAERGSEWERGVGCLREMSKQEKSN